MSVNAHLEGPYIVAGPEAYLIGQMDGTFPSYGEHIAGEMAGLWRHPYKLIRDIRMGWTVAGGDPVWLQADAFRRGPWYVEQEYGPTATLRLTRRIWAPDDRPGILLEVAAANHGAEAVHLNLLFCWLSDLHPGWLDEAPRGQDSARAAGAGVLFMNSASPWWVACVADAPGEVLLSLPEIFPDVPHACTGATTRHALHVPPGGRVHLSYWVGSGDGAPSAIPTFPADVDAWRQAKERRYDELEETAQVTVPDETLSRALYWMKPQTDWLMRTVPGRGTGLGAGVPEYPWWFSCDTSYAVKGVLAFGQHGWAKETLALISDVSGRHNGNGRIVHEVSTTGVVYNPGNAQESPQFCDAVWETFCWTGDEDWLLALYPAVADAMSWVLGEDGSGRDLAPGYGIIEIEGLNLRMLDTAVYTYQGLMAYAAMTRVIGDMERADVLKLRAQRLKERILAQFWIPEEGLFGDFLAQPGEVEERAALWSRRAVLRGQPEAALQYGDLRRFARDGGESVYLMKNWIINTPLEVGMAPPHLAKRALDTMRRSPEFHGPWGLYLSAIDRREIMTISTGVQAVAEIQYGEADAALGWMLDIAKTMNRRSPGTISEMSPDYGCFVQAWTAYGLWYPLVTGFFGLKPRAHRRELAFQPIMPSTWEQAAIHQVRMGDTMVDCEFWREADCEWYRLSTHQPWTIYCQKDLMVDQLVNGKAVHPSLVQLSAGGSVTFAKRALDV